MVAAGIPMAMPIGTPLLPVLLLASCTGSGARAAGAAPPPTETIAKHFTIPPDCSRQQVAAGSFAHYLRHLPLKPAGTPVRLYNGAPKGRQDVHAAVVDITTGTKDLQQCADAVIRLRAEHLYASGRQDRISFAFTNGFRADWARWREGERVRVTGNSCAWAGGAAPDGSHTQLLRYLETVFLYAGTLSLSKELVPAADLPLEAGDVFIQGGSPGHAVLVLDVAQHPDGRVFFLLGQGYMPAQDFHVLRNPSGTGAWYELGREGELRTPEWTFHWSDRKRWRE